MLMHYVATLWDRTNIELREARAMRWGSEWRYWEVVTGRETRGGSVMQRRARVRQ